MMTAPPRQPSPLSQDELLNLFSDDDTGANYILEPALPEDMCDPSILELTSLEVVYDKV